MQENKKNYCPDCGYVYSPGEGSGPCGDCLHKAETDDDRKTLKTKKED